MGGGEEVEVERRLGGSWREELEGEVSSREEALVGSGREKRRKDI